LKEEGRRFLNDCPRPVPNLSGNFPRKQPNKIPHTHTTILLENGKCASPVYTDTFFSAILHKSMDIVINPRGNGACPLCEQNGICRIQSALFKAMEGFSAQDDPMEVVVYSCPQFQEKL
jgi:hypothetical protein